jgi:membrane protease YdiL (CAAX protease family)
MAAVEQYKIANGFCFHHSWRISCISLERSFLASVASALNLGTNLSRRLRGLGLGLFAHGYLALLQHIPASAEIIRKSQEQIAKIPNLKISYAVMAVGFAPFAEEYLFRGLLFRALDREWGGWHAVVGSAAFFAIYHPALSWPPVALLGIANALLFNKTGRLAPAVVLHMIYNAVVLL